MCTSYEVGRQLVSGLFGVRKVLVGSAMLIHRGLEIKLLVAQAALVWLHS